MPGVLAAIAVDGTMTTVEIGYRDARAEVPLRATDRLRLSSLMKPFTAAAVLDAAAEGLIDVDEPVASRLRSIEIDDCVTLRHLLTHTSGLACDGYYHLDEGWPIPTLAQFYEARPLRVTQPPGTRHAYSNHGYAVAGQLLADVVGSSFEQAAVDRVLEPVAAADLDPSRVTTAGRPGAE